MSHKKSDKRMALRPGRPQTHGGFSILTLKGKLPEHRREVARYLTAIRIGLCRDLGPTEQDLTTAQLILIDRTVTALGIVRCIEEYIRENSVMKGSDLAPALQQSYLAYVNHIRLNLVALGLKARAGEGVLDLGTYIKAKDAEKSRAKPRKYRPEAVRGKAEAEGQGMDDSAGGKQIDPRASGGDISGQPESGIDCEAESGQDQGSESGGIGQPGGLHNEGEGKDDDRKADPD